MLKRYAPLKRGGPLRRKSLRKKLRKVSLGSLKAKLWKVFSEYTRKRYADHLGMVACITCEKVDHWKQMDAGHYIPKSLGLSIYFEERSVFPQCTACNRFRHGNLTQYARFLLNKFGPTILEELDAQRRQTRKISAFEYEELIAHYKAKAAQLTFPEAA